MVASLLALLMVSALLASCSSSHSTVHRLPGAGWVGAPPSARPDKAKPSAPNIVFVLTDDLSWNLLRFMPHVRAMQRDGMTFHRYFVTDSLCCPSRSSIFTGEFPHNNGVLNNEGPNGGFEGFLRHNDQLRTFATVLQKRGYLTGMFGKYLNRYEPQVRVRGQRPYVAPGWSAWTVPNVRGYSEYGYTLSVGRRLGTYGSTPDDYLTHVLSDKASSFISTSAAARQPFFAEIATFAPHQPFVAAPDDLHRFPHLKAPRAPAYGHAVRNAPPWLARIPPLTPRATRRLNDIYRLRAQSVLAVDRMIGRLRAQLRRLGVADNTYLVFSSDNGMHLGEHDLRQGKGTAFDTDISVPLVVVGPGVAADSDQWRLGENVDLAPTFESMAGAVPPRTIDGRSLLPLLHGRPPANWRTGVLVEHAGPTISRLDPDLPVRFGGNSPSYEALRTANYLYVEYVDGEAEFYNLRRDPHEQDNRYAVMSPALRTRLHDALARMSACRGTAQCWRAQKLAQPSAIQ